MCLDLIWMQRWAVYEPQFLWNALFKQADNFEFKSVTINIANIEQNYDQAFYFCDSQC